MASTGEALQAIKHLRRKLIQVFAENGDVLFDEVGSITLLTPKEHKDLYTTEGHVERLIDLILQKGEVACKRFLDLLENMIPKFPALHDLSNYLEGFLSKQNNFLELVETMKMKLLLTSKLTLRDALSIDLENLHDKPPKTVEDLPWNYLRKLMALNKTARDIFFDKGPSVDDDDCDENDLFNDCFNLRETNLSNLIHPLDVLCVLLYCADNFLQQEIVTKMAMSQFAVPLLLPSSDGSHCTFMLWAMRDIVKKWRPQTLTDSKGFKEENVVNIALPIFSFVKLGKSKLSKSKTLNQVLNPAQLHNEFFIHDNMNGGNLERKISDGLVEMSWYFPCGKSDVFPEPIAVTNLRGDLEASWDQFTFLTRVSAAVFIFVESISEMEFRLLSSCSKNDTQYYFIVTPGPGKTVSTQTKKTLQELSPVLNLKKSNLIIYAGTENEATFVSKLQSSMVKLLHGDIKRNIIANLGKETCSFNIHVDESNDECQEARKLACNITEEIKDVAEYKQRTMMLQGDLWKRLSKVEKEICRMTNQGGKDVHQYQGELIQEHSSIREKQSKHDLSRGIMLFIDAITHLSKTGKQYFLKWMKTELDSIARDHLSALQDLYKEKCNDKTINKEELQRTDQKISDSSLGIEHFLREMGQFYEAEYCMLKTKKIDKEHRQFTGLPGIASDLLLDGFPLELIDGDASSIPLQWIADVLTELDTKTERKCKMRVITVLGVQSTGKSTLLNTMFGLQFPVASGRCTRGAFMTLLKVKSNFQEELGCHFILVIDTEGLKAPELASLEGSYQHDNELATLVVGLSDISIINMAMENTTEMKDILQIVVHAFLRMKEVGKKPNCQFVHQNVSDVSAHNKNMRDRKKLLEQLDEMTKVAANMELKNEIEHFSDVMDYNLEKDNWYIPGLWLGVPPMASINSGYSEHVAELKKHLLEFMKCKESLHRPLTIPEFITWIESLWNAVKHEKFIFSFRNSLVAEAYDKLSIEYSQWEWDFRKTVHDFMTRTETNIKNEAAESLNDNVRSEFKNELDGLLFNKKNDMLDLLENYFEKKQENVHLIERYKEDFVLSIDSLKKELERKAMSKYEEVVSIQKAKIKIQNIQSSSQKSIEEKITCILTEQAKSNQKLSDEEVEQKFEELWERTMAYLQIEKIERRVVGKSMLLELVNDMRNKGSVPQDLLQMKDLEKCVKEEFTIDKKYIKSGWLQRLIGFNNNEPYERIKRFSVFLINKCDGYIKEKVQTAEDYNETYCKEILHMSNTELIKESKNLHYSPHFELDIKCHILGRSSGQFQAMHDKYIKENDPKLCLEKLKPQYLATFINTFQEKDLCQTKAKEFCEQCLKPAMKDYVFKQLGNTILDDIIQSSANRTFSSRTFFQSFLLKELLEGMSFWGYVTYICSYEEYTKEWIMNYIEKKYADAQSLKSLEENILLAVDKEVRVALTEDKSLKASSIANFLESVCEKLKTVLVIPHSAVKVVTFQNMAAVGQFSSDIQPFLQVTEREILSELQSMDISSVLSRVTLKPQDELFRKVVGCGKQCPFCKVPCEAGGGEHKEHFATIHRPRGLGRCRWASSQKLTTDICSSSVVSDVTFMNSDTEGKWHPYKEYRTYYPDWCIQPDPSIESSDYWKYILVQFNEHFAEEYKASPADVPDNWKTITKEQALENLKKVFNES